MTVLSRDKTEVSRRGGGGGECRKMLFVFLFVAFFRKVSRIAPTAFLLKY